MKSSNRVLLPIALVIAIIFGITFISNYTGSPQEKPKEQVKAGGKNTDPPLLFGITTAEPNYNSYILRNVQLDWEVGIEGHFDFWFHNPHPEAALVNLQGKSCTCAGAQLGIVPADSTRRAIDLSLIGAFGPAHLSLGLMPLTTLALVEKIEWSVLSMESEAEKKSVPAAGELLPQLGILKVTFSGKAPSENAEPRSIEAKIFAQLPSGVGVSRTLAVKNRIIPSIKVYGSELTPGNIFLFGDTLPEQISRKELYLFSYTRPELEIRTEWSNKDDEDPCITISKPIPVEGVEFNQMTQKIMATLGPYPLRCLYRIDVTISERVELEENKQKVTKRLEMGPFEKTLLVKAGDGTQHNSQRIILRGIVRGELSVVGGPNDKDRIDFGRAVSSRTGGTKEVEVISSTAGLDVELVADATQPAYLETKMTLKSEEGGRKRWILTVRIPPDKLNGSLPASSAVILQVKDATKRRIRIPVIGNSLESRPF